MKLLPRIHMVFQIFCISHGWIVNVGILFRPVHHLLRVECTLDKGGGNFT